MTAAIGKLETEVNMLLLHRNMIPTNFAAVGFAIHMDLKANVSSSSPMFPVSHRKLQKPLIPCTCVDRVINFKTKPRTFLYRSFSRKDTDPVSFSLRFHGMTQFLCYADCIPSMIDIGFQCIRTTRRVSMAWSMHLVTIAIFGILLDMHHLYHLSSSDQ